MILTFVNANGQLFKVPHDRIMFVLKKPLEPVIIVALISGTIIPCNIGGSFNTFDDLQNSLEQNFGFSVFVSYPDSGIAVLNLDHMLFYTSPELGVYGLIFNGQSGIVVKASEQDISDHFENPTPESPRLQS